MHRSPIRIKIFIFNDWLLTGRGEQLYCVRRQYDHSRTGGGLFWARKGEETQRERIMSLRLCQNASS